MNSFFVFCFFVYVNSLVHNTKKQIRKKSRDDSWLLQILSHTSTDGAGISDRHAPENKLKQTAALQPFSNAQHMLDTATILLRRLSKHNACETSAKHLEN